MKSRVTVQAFVDGQWSEFVARSTVKTEQEMVDWMHANKKDGVTLRFIGENGIMVSSTK